MHRAKHCAVWTLCLGVLASSVPMRVAGAPQSGPPVDPATTTAAVEPVAGVTYAQAAPLSEIGLGMHNYFGISFTVAETFDNNVFVDQQSRKGGHSTEVSPTFVFGRMNRRTQLRFSYRPGFRMYSQLSDLNTLTHNLALDFSHSASRKWTLSFGSRFRYAPGTDSAFVGFSSARTLDPLLGVQPVATTLREDLLSSTSYFDVQYQWSLRSYVAFGTTYRRRNPSGGSFIDSQSTSGRASYNYRYSRNSTLAAIYQYDRAWFGGGFGQSEGHALLLGNSFRVGKRIDLSLSVGPSYRISDGQQNVALSPLLAFLFGAPTLQLRTVQRSYGVAATGRFAYNFTNSSVELSYARSVNNGGDVFGSTESKSIRTSLTRRLSRNGSLTLGADYVTSDFQRGVSLPFPGVDRLSGSLQYAHSLSDTTSMFVRYRYTQQLMGNSALDDSRYTVTLGFTFSPMRAKP